VRLSLGVLTRDQVRCTSYKRTVCMAWSAASEIARVALERYPLKSLSGRYAPKTRFGLRRAVCGYTDHRRTV
jgi:hypothetical protein